MPVSYLISINEASKARETYASMVSCRRWNKSAYFPLQHMSKISEKSYFNSGNEKIGVNDEGMENGAYFVWWGTGKRCLHMLKICSFGHI